MKHNFYLFFTAIITLIVFTYTSCVNSLLDSLPQEADIYQIEIGKGTPYYVYLDSNYNIIENPVGINDPDPGKTALLVDDNQLAEGVMALAETTLSGTTVRLINKNNNSNIYMFFEQGNDFPSSFIIEIQGTKLNAFLSNYDTHRECYSITFEQNGDFFTYDNIIMSRSILSIYDNDLTLTLNQNTRIKSIYTALGIYASLFNVFSDEDNTIYFSFWSTFKNIFKVVFVAVAIVAVCVAVIFAAPIVIGSVAATIIGIGSVTSFIALGIAIGAGIGAIITAMLPDVPDSISPPSEKPFIVRILKDEVPINLTTVFPIKQNNYIDFAITFINRMPDSKIKWHLYDPFTHAIVASNQFFFEFSVVDNGSIESDVPENLPSNFILRIHRNNRGGTGYDDGELGFCIYSENQNIDELNGQGNYSIDIPDPDGTIKTYRNAFIIIVKLDNE